MVQVREVAVKSWSYERSDILPSSAEGEKSFGSMYLVAWACAVELIEAAEEAMMLMLSVEGLFERRTLMWV